MTPPISVDPRAPLPTTAVPSPLTTRPLRLGTEALPVSHSPKLQKHRELRDLLTPRRCAPRVRHLLFAIRYLLSAIWLSRPPLPASTPSCTPHTPRTHQTPPAPPATPARS